MDCCGWTCCDCLFILPILFLSFISYNKPLSNDESVAAVFRATWDGETLQNAEDIFIADAGVASVSSLVFDAEGYLYLSLYGDGNDAQDLSELRGKTLRLTDTGTVPEDNPFVGVENARSEIFTYGHRTIQGLELNPKTGEIWSLEMGSNGGDEINTLKSGANYGWPVVSLGRDYAGPWQSNFHADGYEDPTVYWMPSISVSGMSFFSGSKIPGWQGDLFVGGLRMGQIVGTGNLQRIRFNGNGEEIRREILLLNLRQPIRGAYQGNDGCLYVMTDADNGALLRINQE